MRRIIAPLLLALSLSACAAGDVYEPWQIPDNPDDVGDPTGTVSEPNIGPIPTTIPEMSYSGVFEVTSHLDVARSNVFGDTISGILVNLSEFHDNPSAAILDVLALCNIPIYSEVWPLIPDFLKEYLEDWLDEYLFEDVVYEIPGVEQAFQLVQDVGQITRDMRLVSSLTLEEPNSSNEIRAQHFATEVGIIFQDTEYMVPIPSDWAEMCAAEPHGTVTPVSSPNPAMPQGLLELDQHAFGIPYGSMLMDVVLGFYGAGSMAELLNSWVDCAGLADTLVGPDSCAWDDLGIDFLCLNDYVSYDDMYSFCYDGLAALGDTVEGCLDDCPAGEEAHGLRSLILDIISFESGRAKMFDKGPGDVYGDYKIHALQDGVWLVNMSLSSALGWNEITIPTTFEGFRVGDAP